MPLLTRNIRTRVLWWRNYCPVCHISGFL